ncbi:head-tail joining protein [Escherichia coli]|uniref:head-tail joining protein n=1 Tax=Escherichia coli TaxID=562 RepID=UPI00207B15F8|nr:head-tail joining protein [Escherichia coli]
MPTIFNEQTPSFYVNSFFFFFQMCIKDRSGAVIRGVFDDPENISYAGQGVRVEGSSPSLFVRTDDVRQLRRGDTLTINGEMFWVDRVSPDDGGSCYLWLNRGQPPAVNRRR